MDPLKSFLKSLASTGASVAEGMIVNKVVREAAKLGNIPGISPETPNQDVLDIQKNLKAAGLAEVDGDPNGALHEEERSFEANGVKVKTKVMVDEQGRVAKLLSAVHES